MPIRMEMKIGNHFHKGKSRKYGSDWHFYSEKCQWGQENWALPCSSLFLCLLPVYESSSAFPTMSQLKTNCVTLVPW